MKTLILEPDPMRARHWVAHFGAAGSGCDIARSPAQARLLLIAGGYDRLCLTMGDASGARFSLLSVARACNPDCEIVDLASLHSRLVTGPNPDGQAGDDGLATAQPVTAPIIG